MTTITVVSQEIGGYPDPLIYWVNVDNPMDEDEVRKAVQYERFRDLGYTPVMVVLFAFEGAITPIADWRSG